MRVKLPGSDKMKKVLLITLLIIAIGILIYEGIMNRKFKDREEISNSSNTMIINSNNSDYIEENNDKVSYGDITLNNEKNAKWSKEYRDGYTLLKNNETGEYLNIENQTGYIEHGKVPKTWWSAQWS